MPRDKSFGGEPPQRHLMSITRHRISETRTPDGGFSAVPHVIPDKISRGAPQPPRRTSILRRRRRHALAGADSAPFTALRNYGKSWNFRSPGRPARLVISPRIAPDCRRYRRKSASCFPRIPRETGYEIGPGVTNLSGEVDKFREPLRWQKKGESRPEMVDASALLGNFAPFRNSIKPQLPDDRSR